MSPRSRRGKRCGIVDHQASRGGVRSLTRNKRPSIRRGRPSNRLRNLHPAVRPPPHPISIQSRAIWLILKMKKSNLPRRPGTLLNYENRFRRHGPRYARGRWLRRLRLWTVGGLRYSSPMVSLPHYILLSSHLHMQACSASFLTCNPELRRLKSRSRRGTRVHQTPLKGGADTLCDDESTMSTTRSA